MHVGVALQCAGVVSRGIATDRVHPELQTREGAVALDLLGDDLVDRGAVNVVVGGELVLRVRQPGRLTIATAGVGGATPGQHDPRSSQQLGAVAASRGALGQCHLAVAIFYAPAPAAGLCASFEVARIGGQSKCVCQQRAVRVRAAFGIELCEATRSLVFTTLGR